MKITFLVIIIIALVLLIFEKKNISSKQIALISALTAIGALGRVPFSAIPGVQPTTFIVIVSGYSLGPLGGFLVGSLSAFISNFFLGQGPWTPWQMLAWGLAGASAGLAAKAGLKLNKIGMAVFCGIWGFLFGWIMNLWMWYSYTFPHSLNSFIVLCLASVWYDSMHAGGNIVFAYLFQAEFIKIISRFKGKMNVKIKSGDGSLTHLFL